MSPRPGATRSPTNHKFFSCSSHSDDVLLFVGNGAMPSQTVLCIFCADLCLIFTLTPKAQSRFIYVLTFIFFFFLSFYLDSSELTCSMLVSGVQCRDPGVLHITQCSSCYIDSDSPKTPYCFLFFFFMAHSNNKKYFTKT